MNKCLLYNYIKGGDNLVAHVLIERKAKALDTTFTYLVPDNLTYEVAVGKRVIVPFGRQKLEGFILKLQDEVDTTYKLKPLEKVIDEEPVLNAEMLELGKYISQKTLASLSSVYQTMLPSALKAHYGFDVKKKYVTYLIPNLNLDGNILKGKQLEVWNYINGKKTLKTKATAISYDAVKALIKKGYLKEAKEEDYRLAPTSLNNTTKKTLTLDQKSVIKEVKNSFNQFKLFLLHGVTGSGKTEVYMNLIESVLKSGKEAIVLVPEISLTPQLIGQFQSRFGHLVAALHSGLSAGEKYDEWRKITRKEVKIVVGARSAIFAPFENLGLIVIDEEHSETYKQENNPKYHAIDVAIFRAKHYNIPLILGSATPSLESYTRAKLGVYKLLEMPNRINDMMPSISLIDMKEEIKKRNPVLSSTLKEAK